MVSGSQSLCQQQLSWSQQWGHGTAVRPLLHRALREGVSFVGQSLVSQTAVSMSQCEPDHYVINKKTCSETHHTRSVPSWFLPAVFIHVIQPQQGAQQDGGIHPFPEVLIRLHGKHYLRRYASIRNDRTGYSISACVEKAVLGFISAPSSLLRLTSHVLTSSMAVWGNNCDGHTPPKDEYPGEHPLHY